MNPPPAPRSSQRLQRNGRVPLLFFLSGLPSVPLARPSSCDPRLAVPLRRGIFFPPPPASLAKFSFSCRHLCQTRVSDLLAAFTTPQYGNCSPPRSCCSLFFCFVFFATPNPRPQNSSAINHSRDELTMGNMQSLFPPPFPQAFLCRRRMIPARDFSAIERLRTSISSLLSVFQI